MTLDYSLLEPIGRHKADFTVRSEGKRNKKRKRKEAAAAKAGDPPSGAVAPLPNLPAPSPPDIAKYIAIGFNSIVRLLDPAARSIIDKSSKQRPPDTETSRLAVVFVDQSSCAEVIWSQLPYLAVAAAMRDGSEQIRVVPLPKGAAARLSTAVDIPRAALVGVLQGAPGASSLVEYVQEHVAAIEIPWMTSQLVADFEPTKVRMHHGPRALEIGTEE